MANEWKLEKRKKEKQKSFWLKIQILIAGILIFLIVGLSSKYWFGKPSQLFESNLNQVGISEEFEFSITGNKGWHYVGIAVNKAINFKLDGNYTVEYYKDDKFLKKEFITLGTLKNYYKEVIAAGSADYWAQMPFGKLYEDGEYRVKVTVHQIEKPLIGYKDTVYFYVDRPYYRLEKYYTDEEWRTMSKNHRIEKLLKNTLDADETNQSLILLRDALNYLKIYNNSEQVQKIKEIIEDNNITVDTDMVFKRRILHYASFHNNIELVHYLINQGVDIHYKDELGLNALAYAIENNATKTAKLLLESGVDIDEVKFVHNYLRNRINGKYNSSSLLLSPLQYTAGNALFEMTELLLQYDIKDYCDINSYGDCYPEDSLTGLQKHLYYTDCTSYDPTCTQITEEERERVLKLFKKYNFQMKQPNLEPSFIHSKQIGY